MIYKMCNYKISYLCDKLAIYYDVIEIRENINLSMS